MGRKNTFNPTLLRKLKAFAKLKYNDKLKWNYDGFDLEELVSAWCDNFLHINDTNMVAFIQKFKNYEIIGFFEVNAHLSNPDIGSTAMKMYLISDTNFRELYMALCGTTPDHWYHFKSRKDLFNVFDFIYEQYNLKNYITKFEKTSRAFIGTFKMLEMNITEIQDIFILNTFSETFFWGSKWTDYPFRDMHTFKQLDNRERMLLQMQAMEQIPSMCSINFRTIITKSIVTVEVCNGAYIINIQYNPITINDSIIKRINKLYQKYYPLDLPLDVIAVIEYFPFVDHINLLNLEPLTDYNFIMASLVANTKHMHYELVDKVTEILEEKSLSIDDKLLEFVKYFKKNLETNIQINNVLLDEKINKLINCKINALIEGEETIEVVKKIILNELDKKLIELNLMNEKVKMHLTGVIEGLLPKH